MSLYFFQVPDFVYDAVYSMSNKQEKGADVRWFYTLLRSDNIFNYFRPSFTYLDLFKGSKMRRITLLAMALHMLASLVFDTTARNITNLNFNIYTSFFITVAIELPADLLSITSSDFLGRRWSAALGLFATGGSMFICSAIIGKNINFFRRY